MHIEYGSVFSDQNELGYTGTDQSTDLKNHTCEYMFKRDQKIHCLPYTPHMDVYFLTNLNPNQWKFVVCFKLCVFQKTNMVTQHNMYSHIHT